MRLRFAALIAVWAAVCPAAPAEQGPLYKAVIGAAGATAHSGPGARFYATEKLSPGVEVEVHRQEPSGWCAIRPLPQSFSWIAGRYLKLEEGGLARVTADGVAVRVGSHFAEAREVSQVQLHRGDVVELVGPRPAGPVAEAEAWHKIAPPAGEFRWVEARHLTPVSGPAAAGEAPRRPPGPPAKDFQTALDDLNTELAILLSENPAQWDCRDLSRRAGDLLSQAKTPAERGHARALVGRLSQVEALKRRNDEFTAAGRRAQELVRAGGADPGRETAADGPARAAAGDAPPGPLPDSARFDGTGRLARVGQARPGTPAYALVDAQGRVTCYVTPAPGVNMQYYLGRQIGVTGTRLAAVDAKSPHLIAKHVTALEGTVR